VESPEKGETTKEEAALQDRDNSKKQTQMRQRLKEGGEESSSRSRSDEKTVDRESNSSPDSFLR